MAILLPDGFAMCRTCLDPFRQTLGRRSSAVLCGLFVVACQDDPWLTEPLAAVAEAMPGVGFEARARYSAFELGQLLSLSLPPRIGTVDVDEDVVLYRVRYTTHDHLGEEVPVSGLLGLPVDGPIKGIVSWHHGTSNYRPDVVSSLSPDEGIPLAAVLSANGYVMLAPDYIGLGVSDEHHLYYHAESTTNAIVDLLKVGSAILDALDRADDRDLYLVGFSQGGHATALSHRWIEQQPDDLDLDLRGSAPIAGPYNLEEVSLPVGFENNNKTSVYYFSYITTSFARLYDQSLRGVLRLPYADQMKDVFDGTHTFSEVMDSLPDTIDELVDPRFLRDFHAGNREPGWVYDGLEQTEVYDWTPVAPMKFFYGTEDPVVTYQESVLAYEHMLARGGNVSAVEVGPYNHVETAIYSLPLVQRWLNRLEAR